MRKVIVVLFAAVTMILISTSAMAETAVAIKDGALVIQEITETMRVPGVPEGMSPQDAYRLYMGEVDKVAISIKRKEFYIFSLPIITAKTKVSETTVRYINGEYMSEPRETIEDGTSLLNWLTSMLFLALPVLGVLIVSLMNKLRNRTKWTLFLFYGAISAMLTISVFLDTTISYLIAFIVGGIVGVLACMSSDEFLDDHNLTTVKIISTIAGAATMSFSSQFIGHLADVQEYGMIFQYFLFIAVVIVASYIIARTAKIIRDRYYPTPKPAVT